MTPSHIAVMVSIASLLFVVFQYFSNRKYQVTKDQQKELDEKIQGVKASIEREQNAIAKDHLNLSLDASALEKRVRKVESIQITEARVHTILKDKIQPLEDEFKKLGMSFSKLEEDIKSHHRDISSEIQRGNRETNGHIMTLLEKVSKVTGELEATRRKDDIRRG